MVSLVTIVLVLYLLFIVIIAAEFWAYLWHAWGAHTDGIPGVRPTHKEHHQADLDHQAHGDFFWVSVLLMIFGLTIYFINYYDWPKHLWTKYIDNNFSYITNRYLFIGLFIVVTTVFVWNWWIHAAYHIKDHWLNQYQWFQKDKKIHFQHHVDPKVNYGIASHFSDIIFGTYYEPLASEVYTKLNYYQK